MNGDYQMREVQAENEKGAHAAYVALLPAGTPFKAFDTPPTSKNENAAQPT